MIQVTIKKQSVKTEEITIPMYFKNSNGWVYRVNQDESHTLVRKNAITNSFNSEFMPFELKEIEPITEQEFKKAFCEKVAELARFEICEPAIKEDELLESDVNGVKTQY